MSTHVENAKACGAKVILGGSKGIEGPTFYQPTLLGDVTDNMQCYTEETFGPLLPVIRYALCTTFSNTIHLFNY